MTVDDGNDDNDDNNNAPNLVEPREAYHYGYAFAPTHPRG
jgi:hypothetical protein